MRQGKYRFGYHADFYYLCLTLIMLGLRLPLLDFAPFIVLAFFVVRFSDFYNWIVVCLFIFAVSYVFIDPGNIIKYGFLTKLEIILASVLAYMVGMRLYYLGNDQRNRAIILFCVAQLSWAVVGILSMIKTTINDPLLLLSRHFLPMFSDEDIHGLYMVANFIIPMVLLPSLIFWLFVARDKTSILEKIILLLVIFAAIAGAFINNELQNRSSFFGLLIGVLLPFFILPKVISQSSKFYYLITIVAMSGLCLIILSYFGYSQFDFLSDGVSSRLERDELNTNGRVEVWLLGLQLVPQYPIGGIFFSPTFMDSGGFFHNLWLDIARISGFIPLLLILIFQIAHVKKFILLFSASFSYEKLFMIINIFSILFMYLTEPILELMPQFFLYSLMIFGYLSKYKVEGKSCTKSS